MVAASALQQAFREAAPNVGVEVLDVLAVCNSMFRRFYAGGYLGLVRHAPAAMGWLYDWMDRDRGHLHDQLRVWVQNLNKLPITRFVRQRRPRLIIHTHFLSAEIVAQMRQVGEVRCPQVTVTTDYETHRLWVQEPMERYYTATQEGREYLTKWGAAPERVLVTGIPVRPEFREEMGRAQARQECELAADLPVVLVLCGGFGVGPTGALLRELTSMPIRAQIVVVTGRNDALRKRLERQVEHAPQPVHVVGFTDRIHAWMRAADLVVTKPGGLTVAESLACGLPLVVVNPIPGQETRNSDCVLEWGAAIKVNNLHLLGYRVSRLLADGNRLESLRSAACAHGQPNAARTIVNDALSLLETSI